MKKILTLFAFLFAVILSLPIVLASSYVEVNGVSEAEEPVSVIVGETIPVKAVFNLNEDSEDVTVRAELAYGHGKEVRKVSDPFDVIANTTYKRYLSIRIPNDIEVTPPGEYYTLSVQAKDGKGKEIVWTEFDITVQRENDLLEIQKILKPLSIEAGKPLLLTIVVKNIGSDEQEDVYLRLTIPALGIVQEKRVGDLEPVDDDDEEDTAVRDFSVRIPQDTIDGTYDIGVRAYNGNIAIEVSDSIVVAGKVVTKETTEVLPDLTSQEIKQGKGVVYQLTLINLGNTAQTYTFEVSGAEAWAQTQINPASVTLGKDSSAVIYVYIAAGEKVAPGQHSFTVNVKSDGTTVKSIDLTADIKETGTSPLLVILIILAAALIALIVFFIITKKKSEKLPEIGEISEESYY